MEIPQESSDFSLISWAATNISAAYANEGELDKAIEYGELGVQEAPTLGDEFLARVFLGWARCRAGETEKGIEDLVSFVQIAQGSSFVTGEIFGGEMLGEGYWLAGEYEKAKETLGRVLDLTERSGAKRTQGRAHRLLGELALKTNLVEAAPHFERAIEISREFKMENDLALAYSGMGRYHKLRGEYAEAWRYLTDALAIFERLGTLIEPDKVRKELEEFPA
jgi:tetratricopeptide (TPR) repeat protein